MRKLYLILIFLIVSITFSDLAANDKDYQIKRVYIEAELNPDGSMDVTETRTFSFQGKFSYLYRSFPKNGPVEFTDIVVKEGAIRFEETYDREPGTMYREEDGDNIQLTWFISARNETRTFKLSYKVLGAVQKFEDVAVLYFQFISPEWNKPQYDVMVTVKTPKILNRYEVKHWLHGPLWAESRLEYDGAITATCEKLPRRNYFEIRALYPLDAFPGAYQQNGRVEQDILTQESIWADEANARREAAREKILQKEKRYRTGRWLIPLLSVILILIWIYIFRKYGSRPKVDRPGDVLVDKPENLSPALVGYLINSRTITGPCLIATIMDLARKELIELQHTEIEKKPGKYKHSYALKLNREKYLLLKEELQDFETSLVDFLFDEIADQEDLLEIKLLKKKQSKFIRFFNKWKKALNENGKGMGWFDRASVKAGNISLVISLLLSLLSGIFVIWFGLQALILAGVSIVIMIISALIPHHTTLGKMKFYEWKAYRKYLNKNLYRSETEEIILNKINDLLIFGTLFAINKKSFKELGSVIPVNRHNHYIPWYVLNSSRSGSFTPAAFGNALASMISTAGSTMSSASGAGGGASGGGGGGAGSGGGGAG
ncbi:DUF2207 family protein [Candidatus Cloacimonadota bacterium]